MDVIAMHAAGFSNAIATLGTAITSEQARILSRYTKRVIISYDADEAGQKAAKRAMQLLGEVGLDISVLKIPDAKDPDEYIKKHGRENFARLLQNTISKFEYNVDGVISKYDVTLPQDKINAVAEIEKLISEVYSSAERDIYITSIAKRLSVDPKSIKNDVERMISKKAYQGRRAEEKRVKETTAGFSDRVNPDYVKAPAIAKNEENVLGLMLLYPDMRNRVFRDKLLVADDFFTDLNKRIFLFLESMHASGETTIEAVNEAFSPEEVGRITKMKINRMSLSGTADSVLEDSIDSLKRAIHKKEATKNNTFEGLEAVLKRKRDS
jgi:DNA primase